MKSSFVAFIILIQVFSFGYAIAEVRLSGYFIANQECPAYQSIRKQTNPNNITIQSKQTYKVHAINKKNGSFYKIETNGKPKFRWVSKSCGEYVLQFKPVATPTPTPGDNQYILAISWQPAFCETRPSKEECQNQTNTDFEATNFTLHGLWPQPRGNDYCNVSQKNIKKDKQKKWSQLPVLALEDKTRNELKQVMPGYESFLHRHEWIKHGTCYNGHSAEKYYVDSLKLMKEINTSKLMELFADNISHKVSFDEIATAFDETFGTGASDRIKVSCKKDGNRNIITEMLINLKGDLAQIDIKQAIANSPSFSNNGCHSGIVDPVGQQ